MVRAKLGRALILVFLLYSAPHTHADWTRFRGPNGSGISPDKKSTPVRWSGSANLKWKTQLPGPGVSSPIIVGDRVYVTCYSGYGLDRQNPGDLKNLKRHLVCIDRQNGEILWNTKVDAVLPEDPYEGIGVTAHGYASSTPVSDGKNVYVFFGKTGALAFDKSGKKLWQTNVGKESDPRRWGSAASPILYQDLLIVPAACESEALVALDKKTGKEVWRQEATGFSSSWGTPILVEVNENRTDLVIGVTQEIWGLNPETGKLRWYSEGAKSGSFCSSAVSDGDVVYAIEGRSGVSMAVRAGGKGDVTESHVLWKGRDSSRFGSPIVDHGRIYSFAGGVATVIDAKTGERITQTRLEGGRGESGGMGGDYASPILADGKLYYVRKSGDLFVLRADEKLKQLALNRLTDEKEEFSSTPAVSDGDLFIRSDKHLYCVSALGQTVKDDQVARG
ncbi:MAG: PQQ-binding-like beta-propeller repeat protein, partial [Planctomycetes bacterium]|nr:PQQ-binding-like beta-propeller repeat protein [Planctomycetota bacterium]